MCNTINVYQTLHEKVANYSPSPELVYSRISTLQLIIRQVEKEGTGIIFCTNPDALPLITKSAGRLKLDHFTLEDLKPGKRFNDCRLLVVVLERSANVKVSDIDKIVKIVIASGVPLKWISILQHPVFNQLFKWELRYN